MTPAAAADAWKTVTAARLPAAALPALAPVRTRPGVTVAFADWSAWAFFAPGDEAVLRCLRPVSDVAFFSPRGNHWHAFGRRLPSGERPPTEDARPLDRVLFPEPLAPVPPPESFGRPVPLTLVCGGKVQPTAALCCSVAAVAAWADGATTFELSSVRAARRGARAVLLGARLPAIAGRRYWGHRVLLPLGMRADPDLGDEALRTACDVADDELLLLDETGPAAIPEAAFAPLTRAGVRLARPET